MPAVSVPSVGMTGQGGEGGVRRCGSAQAQQGRVGGPLRVKHIGVADDTSAGPARGQVPEALHAQGAGLVGEAVLGGES